MRVFAAVNPYMDRLRDANGGLQKCCGGVAEGVRVLSGATRRGREGCRIVIFGVLGLPNIDRYTINVWSEEHFKSIKYNL